MQSDLTGIWQADDGGTYYLRQFPDSNGNLVLWWAGFSKDGNFFNGLRFCNVFHGTINGHSIIGEWSDVPRGETASHGELSLIFTDGNLADQRLQNNGSTTPFRGSLWFRVLAEVLRGLSASADVLLGQVLKNVVRGGHSTEKETLKEATDGPNLDFLKDAVSVFGTVAAFGDHLRDAVTVNWPPDHTQHSYHDFITLNSPSFFGQGSQPDGDVTFEIQVDVQQINTHQPDFFTKGWSDLTQVPRAQGLLQRPIEGEIIMFGKSVDDESVDNTAPSLFPGWGETGGNAVLFNGRPIPVQILPPGIGTTAPNFLNQLTFGDRIRVTGVLVFDLGHVLPGGGVSAIKLEIHPVYTVEKITATGTADLSGVWADDFGNTFYLRHELLTNAIWYLGLSPLGQQSFAQVYKGKVDSQASTITGNVAALSLGFGFEPTTPLGATGIVIFAIDSGKTTLTAGRLQLQKLYDL